jgi:hypothetical protein
VLVAAPPPAALVTPPPAGVATPVAPASRLEEDDAQALAALRRALEARRPALAPGTVELVERNLAVIDEALREIRAALAADPGDPLLAELLRATAAQKLALLRRVLALGPPG